MEEAARQFGDRLFLITMLGGAIPLLLVIGATWWDGRRK